MIEDLGLYLVAPLFDDLCPQAFIFGVNLSFKIYVQTGSKKLGIFLGYNHFIKQCNFKIFSNHQLLEKGSCTHRLHTLNEINTLNNFKWSIRISYLASYEFLS